MDVSLRPPTDEMRLRLRDALQGILFGCGDAIQADPPVVTLLEQATLQFLKAVAHLAVGDYREKLRQHRAAEPAATAGAAAGSSDAAGAGATVSLDGVPTQPRSRSAPPPRLGYRNVLAALDAAAAPTDAHRQIRAHAGHLVAQNQRLRHRFSLTLGGPHEAYSWTVLQRPPPLSGPAPATNEEALERARGIARREERDRDVLCVEGAYGQPPAPQQQQQQHAPHAAAAASAAAAAGVHARPPHPYQYPHAGYGVGAGAGAGQPMYTQRPGMATGMVAGRPMMPPQQYGAGAAGVAGAGSGGHATGAGAPGGVMGAGGSVAAGGAGLSGDQVKSFLSALPPHVLQAALANIQGRGAAGAGASGSGGAAGGAGGPAGSGAAGAGGGVSGGGPTAAAVQAALTQYLAGQMQAAATAAAAAGQAQQQQQQRVAAPSGALGASAGAGAASGLAAPAGAAGLGAPAPAPDP